MRMTGSLRLWCWTGETKDYKEKIDFQDIFIAVVNWPISELYGAFVGIMHYLDQSATGQLNHVFLVAGCWVSVDFDSKYKILWGETRAQGVPNHEEEEKFQNKNLHNYSNFSTPYNIRLTQLGVEGETHTVLPSRL